VKRVVSLQFINPNTVGRTPWTGDQPVARPSRFVVNAFEPWVLLPEFVKYTTYIVDSDRLSLT
jgi:hypothetical protein